MGTGLFGTFPAHLIVIMTRMTEQKRRMTYEEQRALREGRMPEPTTAQKTPVRTRSTRSMRTPSTRVQTADARTNRTQSERLQAARKRVSQRQAQQRQTRQRGEGGEATAKRLPILKIAIAVVAVLIVVFAVRMCASATPINVTINGTSYELRGAKTMQTAIKTSGLPINPGDFISLNGHVLEKSAGDPFYATVNDKETVDPDYSLRDGDTVTITDGKDIVEEYDSAESPVAYGAIISGVGAVHKFEPGTEGVLETRTGRVSGETVERQTVDPIDVTCKQYNLSAGANKVVAFTFDDGPSKDYTAAVLDILAENDAKATFFCIGTEVESYPALVKREYEEGHQVCTHSYDHADPVGGTDIGLMDTEGQIDEIVRGMQTIEGATGATASRVVRMPGGNLSEEMVLNLQPYIDYEIGWNVDTRDWTLPGAEAIYEAMISVDPGDIVLCHDGGGDRSQTIEALKRAIPYLKQKGYTFVTMDEILQYPASA